MTTMPNDEERNAAGLTAEQIEAVKARRQYITDTAQCQQCRTDRKTCEAGRGDAEGPEGLCCWGGIGHRHIEDARMVSQLVEEVAAGHVRTVAEAYPPPVLGPARVSMTWLLEQRTWWYPQGRPAVRVASMDRPWRWNVARHLERRAPKLEHADRWRGIWADAPDDVWAMLERRTPQEFLDESPLYRALTRQLPKVDSRAGRLLAARAVHWNTCPMRAKHPAPSDTCVCVRDGGRIVGATNDPGATA
jgi:hypothetical protein